MSFLAGSPEANAFLEDEFWDEELTDVERRRGLELQINLAEAIEHELRAKSGPLYLYIRNRRAEARSALRDALTIDVSNEAGRLAITQAQTRVEEYLKVCVWVASRLDEATEARTIIAEEFPQNGRPPDDPEQPD